MKTKFASAQILTKTLTFKKAVLWIVLSIALGFVPRLEAASYELVSREATGYGDSEDAAIVAALVEAVRQFQGLTIEAEKTLRVSLVETESKQELRTQLEENIRSKSKGQIHSYEVISVTPKDRRWTANLRVSLPEYRSPGPDRSSLRSIAILPFRDSIPHSNLPTATLSHRWGAKLVSHFAQSRRFRVLDREFANEFTSEEALLRQGETPVSELVRIGQKIGADYVVVGEISAFEMNSASTVDSADEANFIVEYRVVELAPREVRWANTANLRLPKEALQRLGIQNNRSQVREYLLNSTAETVVTEILDLIYPVKILRVDADGTIYLNQGGNRVQNGQWFSIYSLAESVPDPDSGLPIRIDGREMGVVNVVDTQGKYARAKLEQGTNETIKAGMVCRRFTTDRIVALQQQAQQEYIQKQQKLVEEGECPSLLIRAFRTSTVWQISVKNQSKKAVKINGISKRLAGATPDTTPFSKTITAGEEDVFGLPYAFASRDALDLICDDFKYPYTFFFP